MLVVRTLTNVRPSQVLTGLRPFHRLHIYGTVSAVIRGEHPEKPLGAESLGFSHALWGLLQLCWSKSSPARPTARQMLNYLSIASLVWDPPPVYPVIGIDAFGITGSDSSGSLETPLTNWTDVVCEPVA